LLLIFSHATPVAPAPETEHPFSQMFFDRQKAGF
jgi:hypothetical protein